MGYTVFLEEGQWSGIILGEAHLLTILPGLNGLFWLFFMYNVLLAM